MVSMKKTIFTMLLASIILLAAAFNLHNEADKAYAASPSTAATAQEAHSLNPTVSSKYPEIWIVPRSGGGAAVVGNVRVTSDYAQVTDPEMIATATFVEKDDPVGKILTEYVLARSGSRQVFGPYKQRIYKGGVSKWDGFGVFTAQYGIGNKYDGHTATVYKFLRDGTITEEEVVVVRGKIRIDFDQMASIMIVLDE